MQPASAQAMPIPATAPAYQVYHQHPGIEPTARLFTHPRLLSARKEAMNHVEHLMAELWLRGDLQTIIKVRLVETRSDSVQPIALIYQLDLPRRKTISLKQEHEDCLRAIEELHKEWEYYAMNRLSMGLGYFHTQVSNIPAPGIYCQLYDAAGYFTEISGQANAYTANVGAPDVLVASSYDDWHHLAAQVHDALAGELTH